MGSYLGSHTFASNRTAVGIRIESGSFSPSSPPPESNIQQLTSEFKDRVSKANQIYRLFTVIAETPMIHSPGLRSTNSTTAIMTGPQSAIGWMCVQLYACRTTEKGVVSFGDGDGDGAGRMEDMRRRSNGVGVFKLGSGRKRDDSTLKKKRHISGLI
ncbi:hypothetical protein SDJN03_14799, partial [Cucurbita argyrosperma subsp. sororia]